jgi:hypothetical protein
VPADRKRGARLRAPGGEPDAQDGGRSANEAKASKLRHGSLRRRAFALGLELRHSAYGYSLIDASRDRVDGRSDMTLDDVEAYLQQQDARSA